MCWQRWDSLEDRKPFYWYLSRRDRIWEGEDKYGRNTFDDSKDCRGKTAVRMGKESRAEAVEWRSILFCRRKNVVCDSDYDRQRRNDAGSDYPEFAK